MADKEDSSTKQPSVSILIQELAQTLSDRARRDPDDTEALEASRALWVMAEPRSGKREKWAREARVYARENPAQIGPIMDRSIEAEALAGTIERGGNGKSAHELLDVVDVVASRIVRQLRISPTLVARADVDMDKVTQAFTKRAESGKLDVEGMAIAICKALGMPATTANNLYKHRG